MKDITHNEDVETLVNAFYRKVRENALLAPVFAEKISDEAWPAHLQRIYAFWRAILFIEKGFEGNPMQKHLRLPVGETHFTEWLRLFDQTIDEHFAGAKADEAKRRARSIAQLMQYKISSLQK